MHPSLPYSPSFHWHVRSTVGNVLTRLWPHPKIYAPLSPSDFVPSSSRIFDGVSHRKDLPASVFIDLYLLLIDRVPVITGIRFSWHQTQLHFRFRAMLQEAIHQASSLSPPTFGEYPTRSSKSIDFTASIF